MFATSQEHLLAEMERIDLLIRSRVAKTRELHLGDERFSGLYISDEEIDRILAHPQGMPNWVLEPAEERDEQLKAQLNRLRSEIGERTQASVKQGVALRLFHLAHTCRLDSFDVDCLLICLAPEIDLRYGQIYAYLQDDVTRKRPTVDLTLNLLCSREKLVYRDRFSSEAPLQRHRLIEVFEEPPLSQAPLLGKCLKLDDRVTSYLLGADAIDAKIRSYTRRLIPNVDARAMFTAAEVKDKLAALLARRGASEDVLVYLQGSYGSGKQGIAESLCKERQQCLLWVDSGRLLALDEDALRSALILLHRECLLQNGILYFDGIGDLWTEGKKPLQDVFLQNLETLPGLVFLVGEGPWRPERKNGRPVLRMEVSPPSASQRVRIWSEALNGNQASQSDLDVQALATKFRLTGGQIYDAVGTAQSLAALRDRDESQIMMQDLLDSCRLHSNQKLTSLARKIHPTYRWGDIVLPADRIDRLSDICNHVRYRKQVYEEWGFDRKLAYGKGLTVLFAGPSGTGKTMAAQIIASELGLDLYKIDLSNVVSKYIGETEKNLAYIFAEAETSNAILFFDEADALFGKRSEVKDSHDRYANIEIGYLLQRMEEYSGVAILATNFRKNMDDAFVRRLQFTVEFPFPNEADRLRIWGTVWPEQMPRTPELDFEFMARRFELTGGSIRNIALAAAFLAADDGEHLNMGHLMRATQREFQKMGKIVGDGEFTSDTRLTFKPKGWELNVASQG